MAKIKPLPIIVEKYTRRTPLATPDYEAGIKAAADWAALTSAANDSWKAAMQGVIARDGFLKGVRAAGTPKWQKKTLEKGPSRWGPGVQGAGPDYEAGYAPYRQVVEATKLSPRYPTGDPRNLNRTKEIVEAEVGQKRKLGG